MPYTTCVKISVGIPGGRPMVCTTCRNGIITAWYGMNMPNRISVNTTSAPGNRQRDSTNPLAAPMNDEISATGIASSKVRTNDGWSVAHALVHESSVHTVGRFHWPLTPISRPDLKLVTISTYAGISTTNTKISRSAYVTARPTGDRRLTTDRRRGAGVVP